MPPQPYFNWGATDNYDRQTRLRAQIERESAVRLHNLNIGIAAYASLIKGKGLARTESDHFDLLLVGLRAGYDSNVIISVIGSNQEEYVMKYGSSGPPFRKTGGKEERADRYMILLNTTPAAYWRVGLYRGIIKAYPTAENYGKLAMENFKANFYANAALAYDTAITKNGGVNKFYSEGRAAAYAFGGNLPMARAAYEQLLLDDPASFAEMNLAWIALRQDDRAAAMRYVRAASAKRPEDAGALLIQAMLTPDAAAAQSLADKATTIRPDVGTGNTAARIFAYAKLLHNAGDFHSSVLFLDMAVAAEPKNVDFLELRFGTNTTLGRAKEAAEDEETLGKL